jgi:molybdate transport system permease protein
MPVIGAEDWAAIRLTLVLATTTTVILLILCTPLAWWLARSQSLAATVVSATTTLPLVLPPTVLGFYLLVLMGDQGPIGSLTKSLGWGLIPFSFAGLLIASVLYSLPFSVQPLQQAFKEIGTRPLEVAASLRASPLDAFFTVVLPMAKPGFMTAAVMTFAHAVGEFGVVLMIGGNIPGRTRVISIQIFDHVEALEYPQAHWLAAGMLVFSFIVLFTLHLLNRRARPV